MAERGPQGDSNEEAAAPRPPWLMRKMRGGRWPDSDEHAGAHREPMILQEGELGDPLPGVQAPAVEVPPELVVAAEIASREVEERAAAARQDERARHVRGRLVDTIRANPVTVRSEAGGGQGHAGGSEHGGGHGGGHGASHHEDRGATPAPQHRPGLGFHDRHDQPRSDGRPAELEPRPYDSIIAGYDERLNTLAERFEDYSGPRVVELPVAESYNAALVEDLRHFYGMEEPVEILDRRSDRPPAESNRQPKPTKGRPWRAVRNAIRRRQPLPAAGESQTFEVRRLYRGSDADGNEVMLELVDDKKNPKNGKNSTDRPGVAATLYRVKDGAYVEGEDPSAETRTSAWNKTVYVAAPTRDRAPRRTAEPPAEPMQVGVAPVGSGHVFEPHGNTPPLGTEGNPRTGHEIEMAATAGAEEQFLEWQQQQQQQHRQSPEGAGHHGGSSVAGEAEERPDSLEPTVELEVAPAPPLTEEQYYAQIDDALQQSEQLLAGLDADGRPVRGEHEIPIRAAGWEDIDAVALETIRLGVGAEATRMVGRGSQVVPPLMVEANGERGDGRRIVRETRSPRQLLIENWDGEGRLVGSSLVVGQDVLVAPGRRGVRIGGRTLGRDEGPRLTARAHKFLAHSAVRFDSLGEPLVQERPVEEPSNVPAPSVGETAQSPYDYADYQQLLSVVGDRFTGEERRQRANALLQGELQTTPAGFERRSMIQETERRLAGAGPVPFVPERSAPGTSEPIVEEVDSRVVEALPPQTSDVTAVMPPTLGEIIDEPPRPPSVQIANPPGVTVDVVAHDLGRKAVTAHGEAASMNVGTYRAHLAEAEAISDPAQRAERLRQLQTVADTRSQGMEDLLDPWHLAARETMQATEQAREAAINPTMDTGAYENMLNYTKTIIDQDRRGRILHELQAVADARLAQAEDLLDPWHMLALETAQAQKQARLAGVPVKAASDAEPANPNSIPTSPEPQKITTKGRVAEQRRRAALERFAGDEEDASAADSEIEARNWVGLDSRNRAAGAEQQNSIGSEDADVINRARSASERVVNTRDSGSSTPETTPNRPTRSTHFDQVVERVRAGNAEFEIQPRVRLDRRQLDALLGAAQDMSELDAIERVYLSRDKGRRFVATETKPAEPGKKPRVRYSMTLRDDIEVGEQNIAQQVKLLFDTRRLELRREESERRLAQAEHASAVPENDTQSTPPIAPQAVEAASSVASEAERRATLGGLERITLDLDELDDPEELVRGLTSLRESAIEAGVITGDPEVFAQIEAVSVEDALEMRRRENLVRHIQELNDRYVTMTSLDKAGGAPGSGPERTTVSLLTEQMEQATDPRDLDGRLTELINFGLEQGAINDGLDPVLTDDAEENEFRTHIAEQIQRFQHKLDALNTEFTDTDGDDDMGDDGEVQERIRSRGQQSDRRQNIAENTAGDEQAGMAPASVPSNAEVPVEGVEGRVLPGYNATPAFFREQIAAARDELADDPRAMMETLKRIGAEILRTMQTKPGETRAELDRRMGRMGSEYTQEDIDALTAELGAAQDAARAGAQRRRAR